MQSAWMLAASFFFAGMGACIKFASEYFGPLEIVGYRGLIGILIVGVLARSRRTSLRTRVPLMHVWRNVLGISALGAWFYAIAHLPLATAMTLHYMSSVWIAVFMMAATLAAGQLAQLRRQGPLMLAILAGFAGVVMVLGPTLGQDQLFAGIVGLLGGITAGLVYLQVAALGRVGEPDTRTVFYYSVGSMLAGLASGPVLGAHSPLQAGALWLIPMGVLGALGQLCMTRAYTHGSTIVVAALQYSGIVFAALFGVILFHDRIAPVGWFGILAIIASGVASTALRERARVAGTSN